MVYPTYHEAAMLFAENDTPSIIATIFTGLTGLLVTLLGVYLSWKANQNKAQSEKNEKKLDILTTNQKAAKDEVVKTNEAMVDKLQEIKVINESQTAILGDVHKCVNGPKRALIRENAGMARRLANFSKLPADIQAAEVAEDRLRINLLGPDELCG